MSGQSGGQRLRLSTLNEQLTCKLCGGYYIDATTIIECLHSFCKSCIVKYLENNKFCPVCDAQVHKNKPLLNIRPDQTLQDIVYKLVPGCYQNEMRCRKEFYAKHPEEKSNVTSPEARGEPVETYIYSPDESLSLSLEYYSPETLDETENNKESASKLLPRRYLRCPAAVTVFHLQKLIRAKYGLSEAHRVDIMYIDSKNKDKEEPLCASYTLMDVMYIYHWRRKVPLHLSYRIFESASKRLKLSDDNEEFKQSLFNSNMELESKDDDQSIKREWKEVQLKISETGVMSVTDISSLDTKKSTKVNEINQQSSLDQASNVFNVNKTVVKTEDKESVKSCTATSKSKKVQQENSTKKCEQPQEEMPTAVSLRAMPISQSNSKSEEMELKSIDQRDLSNELLKSSSEKYENNCSKVSTDFVQTSSSGEKNQAQNVQHPPGKIKTEPPSIPEKRSEVKQNVTNNNFINTEAQTDINAKQNAKSSETKTMTSAGSKINALSAKLQFQPKVGQVNNTYSKKSTTTDKKTSSSSPAKSTDVKPVKTSSKSEVKPSCDVPSNNSPADSSESKPSVVSTPSSVANVPTPYTQNNLMSASSVAATYVTAPSATIDSCATSVNLQHHHQHQQQQHQQHNNALHTLAAPSTESLASIGLHVSTTIPSQVGLNSWMTDRNAVLSNSKTSTGKSVTADQQLRSLPGIPQIGKDIVCSTTSANPTCSMGRFNIQTPSMSIYSITTSMKNNVYTSAAHSYTTPTKQASTKSNFDMSSMYPVPPCPDAIPISLMKPANARKDAVTKGSTLNEICAKISNANSGSKINDICAKIGESSKEKNKIEAQRSKPEVPDLLKISKKSPTTPTSDSSGGNSSSGSPVKHIPNIPNVPIYTPSNSQPMQVSSEGKESAKRLTSVMSPSQAAMMAPQMQKMPSQKKHSQAVGYKTLRDPPKPWNPTLSKNNYVTAKNQAKEMQNQTQATYGLTDGSSASKQIPSKPAKIFKIRNMPRYLGAPASGVKPIYGVVNEQSKTDKDQSTVTKNSSTMSMMKIDPQTLSPIVSSPNSPIVSPPPYSPTARGYQSSPFTRDICRNSNSPISPRNSPVNMLSTNPFIPSHTPNTNPRLIYSHFPPAYTDASRFSNNPLIRSPIGIPPPSAFHSSLPPSINKLYQRSGYMTQPQTSVTGGGSGFSPSGAAGQPPAVQRIPPSSHASPSPSASSPSSSKSPKTSSSASSPGGAGGASMNLARPETLSTTASSTSMVGSVALQLAKGLAQRNDLNVFDLTRAESLKSGPDNSGAKQMSAPMPQPAYGGGGGKSSETSTKSKSSPSAEPQKIAGEAAMKQNDAIVAGKGSEMEAKAANATMAMATKESEKKEKSSLAKVNGGITITMASSEKPKDGAASSQQQQGKVEKSPESKCASGGMDKSSASPSLSPSSKSAASCKAAAAQEMDKTEVKQTSAAQQKQEIEVTDTVKTASAPVQQGKKVAEVQKGKTES